MTLREHPDDSVVVLDKLTYAGNERNLDLVSADPRFRFVRGDICDSDTVRDVAAGVDVIVNFAAESHVDRSLEAPGQFILTDVYGTFVLMDAARDHHHQRFVQVSTDEVYGEVISGRSVESDPLHPRSPYSASKAGGELQVQAYRESIRVPRHRDPRFQHLRAVPVPGEDHPAVHHERHRRPPAADLWRRHGRPRLSLRRGSRARYRLRTSPRCGRHGLQHRRRWRDRRSQRRGNRPSAS